MREISLKVRKNTIDYLQQTQYSRLTVNYWPGNSDSRKELEKKELVNIMGYVLKLC